MKKSCAYRRHLFGLNIGFFGYVYLYKLLVINRTKQPSSRPPAIYFLGHGSIMMLTTAKNSLQNCTSRAMFYHGTDSPFDPRLSDQHSVKQKGRYSVRSGPSQLSTKHRALAALRTRCFNSQGFGYYCSLQIPALLQGCMKSCSLSPSRECVFNRPDWKMAW